MSSHEEIRRHLEQRLAQLEARTSRIEADLRKPGDRDWAERAIESANDEVLERLDDAERSEMREIRAALARIESGQYGTCQRCGAAIQGGRLKALPYTVLCIDCAS